jgi:hypothetical protein
MTNDDRIRFIDSENQKLNNPEILSHAVAQNTKRYGCEEGSLSVPPLSLFRETHFVVSSGITKARISLEATLIYNPFRNVILCTSE